MVERLHLCHGTTNDNPRQTGEVTKVLRDYPSRIDLLQQDGYHFVEGLRTIGMKLTPATSCEAWQLIQQFDSVLSEQPCSKQAMWTLDDHGGVREVRGYSFRRKQDKSFVTLTSSAAHRLSLVPALPAPLAEFFATASLLMDAVDDTLTDVAPTAPWPTFTVMRVFNYYPSPLGASGLEAHIDGSRFTVIIANSDGCLQILNKDGLWQPIDRGNSRPFAILIPGGAIELSDVRPTLHRVAHLADYRHSTTVFQVPVLGETEEQALAAAATRRPTR